MKNLNILMVIACLTALCSLSTATNAQHFTNPVINPGTKKHGIAHSPSPIPPGTKLDNGWVTTRGSTATNSPYPNGATITPSGRAGGGGNISGGVGGAGWGGSNGVRNSTGSGGGCGQNACFDDNPGRDW
jgi:hypothetical protein